MNGEVAQLVALAAHGNAFLCGGHDARDFYPANRAFVFCNEVSFVELKKFIKTKERLFAANPNEWFALLKDGACRRLSLGHRPTPNPPLPDHISTAFVGGGGYWLLVADYAERADYWAARWGVSAPKAPDRKIWKVTYAKVASGEPDERAAAPDLSARRRELESVLKRVETFARAHGVENFADCFAGALEALEAGEPAPPSYYSDLLPPEGYGAEARRVLAACAHAWVFGGMGSWNDLGFDPAEVQTEYERLSAELYAAVSRGIEEGANSYGR
jgi:hypothetical protein